MFETTNDAGVLDFNLDGGFILNSQTSLSSTADNLISIMAVNTNFTIGTSTTFELLDQHSSLYYDTIGSTLIDVTDSIDFTSHIFEIEANEGDFDISATDFIDLSVGGLASFEILDDFTIIVGNDAKFTAVESYRSIFDDNIAITSSTITSITTSSTRITTLPGSEGSITLESPVSTYTTGANAPLYINAFDDFELAAVTNIDITSLGFEAVTTGEISNIEFETEDLTITLNNAAVLTIISGDHGSTGSISITGN